MRVLAVAALAAALSVLSASAAFADTTGLVRGTATLSGKSVAAVSITLSGEGTSYRSTTDANGGFVFPRVPFGRYTLTAHRAGSPDTVRTIDVESDAIVVVSLELDAGLKEIGRAQAGLTKTVGSAPVSVNAVTRAQIAALPQSQSLNSVIETAPGVVHFS